MTLIWLLTSPTCLKEISTFVTPVFTWAATNYWPSNTTHPYTCCLISLTQKWNTNIVIHTHTHVRVCVCDCVCIMLQYWHKDHQRVEIHLCVSWPRCYWIIVEVPSIIITLHGKATPSHVSSIFIIILQWPSLQRSISPLCLFGKVQKIGTHVSTE